MPFAFENIPRVSLNLQGNQVQSQEYEYGLV